MGKNLSISPLTEETNSHFQPRKLSTSPFFTFHFSLFCKPRLGVPWDHGTTGFSTGAAGLSDDAELLLSDEALDDGLLAISTLLALDDATAPCVV